MKLSSTLYNSIKKDIAPTTGISVTGTSGQTYDLDGIIAAIRRDNPSTPLLVPSQYDSQIITHLITLILSDYAITVPEGSTELATAQTSIDSFENVLNRYINSYYAIYKASLPGVLEGSVSLDTIINRIDIAHDAQAEILTDKTIPTQSQTDMVRAFVSNGNVVPSSVISDSADIFYDHYGNVYAKAYDQDALAYSYKQITAGDDEKTVNALRTEFTALIAAKIDSAALTQSVGSGNDTDGKPFSGKPVSSAGVKAYCDGIVAAQAIVDAAQNDVIRNSMSYTNFIKTPTSLGGIATGTTFNSSLPDVISALLYPYHAPRIKSVSIGISDGSDAPAAYSFSNAADASVTTDHLWLTDRSSITQWAVNIIHKAKNSSASLDSLSVTLDKGVEKAYAWVMKNSVPSDSSFGYGDSTASLPFAFDATTIARTEAFGTNTITFPSIAIDVTESAYFTVVVSDLTKTDGTGSYLCSCLQFFVDGNGVPVLYGALSGTLNPGSVVDSSVLYSSRAYGGFGKDFGYSKSDDLSIVLSNQYFYYAVPLYSKEASAFSGISIIDSSTGTEISELFSSVTKYIASPAAPSGASYFVLYTSVPVTGQFFLRVSDTEV